MLSYHTSPLAPLGGKKSGGMNVYVRELSRELAAMGHGVDVFTRGSESPQDLGGARLISLPAGPAGYLSTSELAAYLPEFILALRNFAESQAIHYDVIHAHYWMSGVIGMHLKQGWRTPMVLMFHTLGLVKNRIAAVGIQESAARIRGERKAMWAADQVIAATPAEQADLQWLYELPTAKVSVIPPGVDLQRFHPMEKSAARAELGYADDERLILFVGRIEALKGIDTLIRALYYLGQSAAAKKLRVLIVGGDVEEGLASLESEMGRLLSLARELGLQDRVSFLGSRNQEELVAHYAAADVVVMPSYSESFGMVALEAMACARPVVASRVGGLKYLVRDGETGYHVQEGDAAELAGRLSQLLSDESLLQRMGQAARAEAEQYSWGRAAESISAVYESVATQPRARVWEGNKQ
jgi:D-inositol-3-phosphate glycosyltransferase